MKDKFKKYKTSILSGLYLWLYKTYEINEDDVSIKFKKIGDKIILTKIKNK